MPVDSHDFDETAVLVTTHRTAGTDDAPRGEDDREEAVAAPLQIPGGGVGSYREREQPAELSAEHRDRMPERLLRRHASCRR